MCIGTNFLDKKYQWLELKSNRKKQQFWNIKLKSLKWWANLKVRLHCAKLTNNSRFLTWSRLLTGGGGGGARRHKQPLSSLMPWAGPGMHCAKHIFFTQVSLITLIGVCSFYVPGQPSPDQTRPDQTNPSFKYELLPIIEKKNMSSHVLYLLSFLLPPECVLLRCFDEPHGDVVHLAVVEHHQRIGLLCDLPRTLPHHKGTILMWEGRKRTPWINSVFCSWLVYGGTSWLNNYYDCMITLIFIIWFFWPYWIQSRPLQPSCGRTCLRTRVVYECPTPVNKDKNEFISPYHSPRHSWSHETMGLWQEWSWEMGSPRPCPAVHFQPLSLNRLVLRWQRNKLEFCTPLQRSKVDFGLVSVSWPQEVWRSMLSIREGKT